ncbi:hypothetical protein A2U01_0115637, partial [Trifolium medium]|nr:hypothetical protein [Trifolium medium]
MLSEGFWFRTLAQRAARADAARSVAMFFLILFLVVARRA